MVLYDIPDRSSIGKDSPYGKSTSLFKPNIVGPGAGKIKAGIYIGYQVGKYILSRPWAKGTLTGTAIGTGLGLDGQISTNVSTVSDNQTYRTTGKFNNRFRRRTKYRNRARRTAKCCCQHF